MKTHRAKHPRVLIATDGVFSMDGDLAPLSGLSALAGRYDAWLLTDDAHGIGVLGGGRGSTFAADTSADVPLQMGTLSKAIGAYGGYLAASRAVIELMHNRARTFVYSTGLPPSSAAAASAALDHHRARARLRRQAAAEGAAVHAPDQSSRRAQPDRADHHGISRGGARGQPPARSRGLPGRRDPAADRAGGHRAAAPRLHRRPCRCRHRAAGRSGARARAGGAIMSALFVTATGTEVGKTFVTCGWSVSCAPGPARHRAQAGRQRLRSGAPETSDSGILLSALELPITPDHLDVMSPWRFAAPLSPDMAARREDRTLDFDALVAFCQDKIARSDRLLIEGIGGLMVPLDDRHTVLDWMWPSTFRCSWSPAAISARSATP